MLKWPSSKAAAPRLTLVSRFTFLASRFTVFGSDARTQLADFFSILLEVFVNDVRLQHITATQNPISPPLVQ
jgi:hypothetical protein